jgi:4a-hydroxytetrahydrobiopterin dehydratase
MTQLRQQQCTACRSDATPVADGELDQMLLELPNWQLEVVEGVKQLEKQFRFPDYAQSMAFALRVGELAEAEDHHPAILIEWGRVRVTWWTHAIKGLHINDFICAAKTDQLVSDSSQ